MRRTRAKAIRKLAREYVKGSKAHMTGGMFWWGGERRMYKLLKKLWRDGRFEQDLINQAHRIAAKTKG